MASFARSFKPPAYLSPCRRPGMPGRSLSNSSELSLASNNSGRSEEVDFVMSRPTTPSTQPTSTAGDHEKPKGGIDASAVTSSSRSSLSNPIAIELPKMRKINSAPVYTPPEPLSARGDLPGGYFPLHEDPRARVHRPHPFHHKASDANNSLQSESSIMPPSLPHAGPTMPVTSYLPTGFHDNPLPMGKYYPSNYEQRTRSRASSRASVADIMPASVKSDTQVPRYRPEMSRAAQEDEKRRRMQQYQRDMIMQTTMALKGTSNSAASISLNGIPIKEFRFNGSLSHKPMAPRLAPLGSPGPVTPMELEGCGGGYLDKGRASDSLPRDGLISPGRSITARTT